MMLRRLSASIVLRRPQRRFYLEAIRETCTARGIVLIFDEVVSCFRMGPAGAEGYFGVRPDISAMGKEYPELIQDHNRKTCDDFCCYLYGELVAVARAVDRQLD